MSKGAGGRNAVAVERIDSRILAAFDDDRAVALTTRAVAERVGVDVSTARDHLSRLADRGELTPVDGEEGAVTWERNRTQVFGRPDGNSYTLEDGATGIVTRGRTRPRALRRLADRIDQYETGDGVCAQILGICDAAITPAYVDGRAALRERFLDPEDVHLYAHVESQGVVEVDEPSQFDRSRTIQGIAVTAVLDRDRFDEVMIVDADTVVAETPVEPSHFPLGVFKLAAVPPAYQRRGIGTALTTHAMAHLAETPPVLSVLWDRDDESNERLAAQFDADRLLTLEDALPFGRRCTVCGYGNECSCDCVLYGWGLDLA